MGRTNKEGCEHQLTALFVYRPERINLLGTEKIIKTWKGGNSHVKYEKDRTNSPL